MASTAALTPTNDLGLVFTPNATDGTITVGFLMTPAGDIATVNGPARLVQDIQRWLLTPVGTYAFNPSYGNPLIGQLLRPAPSDPGVFKAMIQAAEASFLADQAQAAAQGYLSQDEMVDHFTDPVITMGDGTQANGPLGTVNVAFYVVLRSGTVVPATAAFSALIS